MTAQHRAEIVESAVPHITEEAGGDLVELPRRGRGAERRRDPPRHPARSGLTATLSSGVRSESVACGEGLW